MASVKFRFWDDWKPGDRCEETHQREREEIGYGGDAIEDDEGLVRQVHTDFHMELIERIKFLSQ